MKKGQSLGEIMTHRRTIFVSNLPHDTGMGELYMIFERYGKINSVYIPREKHSQNVRGYGFIEFKKTMSAFKAAKGGSIPIRDRQVQVRRSSPENSRQNGMKSEKPFAGSSMVTPQKSFSFKSEKREMTPTLSDIFSPRDGSPGKPPATGSPEMIQMLLQYCYEAGKSSAALRKLPQMNAVNPLVLAAQMAMIRSRAVSPALPALGIPTKALTPPVNPYMTTPATHYAQSHTMSQASEIPQMIATPPKSRSTTPYSNLTGYSTTPALKTPGYGQETHGYGPQRTPGYGHTQQTPCQSYGNWNPYNYANAQQWNGQSAHYSQY